MMWVRRFSMFVMAVFMAVAGYLFIANIFMAANGSVLQLQGHISLGPLYIIVPLVLLAAVLFGTRHTIVRLTRGLLRRRWLLILGGSLAVLGSLAFRLYFVLADWVGRAGDVKMTIYQVNELVKRGNLLGNTYESMNTYLYPYHQLLAWFVRGSGIHTAVTAAIVLNSLIDVAVSVVLFFVVRRITRRKLYAYGAAIVWFANPVTTVISVIALSLTLVNTLVLMSVVAFLCLNRRLENHRLSITLSIATGVLIGVLNVTRPLGVVLLIAIAIYLLFGAIGAHWRMVYLRPMIVSFVIMVASFMLVEIGMGIAVKQVTGLQPVTDTTGWSMYVGTNYQTWGTWNSQDRAVFTRLMKRGGPEYAEKQIEHDAVTRTLHLGPTEMLALGLRKAAILGTDTSSTYDIQGFTTTSGTSAKRRAIYYGIGATFLVLFLAAILLARERWRQRRSPGLIGPMGYIELTFVGMFAASLLVEVQARYIIPFVPLLLVYIGIGYYRIIPHPSAKLSSKITPHRRSGETSGRAS